MHSTTASTTPLDNLERNRSWLATADGHSYAGPITTGDFAMQAVGRLLLEDIVSMRCPSVVG